MHVFGYASDIERADVLYTSVLVQMWHGLVAAQVPARADNVRAWRRSWLLGYTGGGDRQGAGGRAAGRAGGDPGRARRRPSSRAALVLADRSLVIRQSVAQRLPGRPGPPG